MSEAVPQPEARTLKLTAPWRERVFPNNEWVLLVVILAECAVFALTGSNFLGSGNAFEITRLAVEIGLLALALDAHHHHGRHRPVGRVDDGAGGGRARARCGGTRGSRCRWRSGSRSAWGLWAGC